MASVAGMVVRRTVWLAALGFALVACRSAQAELIKVVDLPKITDATPLELGTVPEANVAGCVITIVNAQSQTNMVVSGYRCVREGDAWIVKSDKASSTALAVVRFDKNRLLFQWSADAPRALADGLRNCLISAQYDKSTETIALRKPVQAPGKPLDLTRESDLVTLELEDVPDQEKLTLELVGISGYDRTVRFMPENRRAQVKQPVMAILNPVETSSLSIQIKTTLNKLGPTLSLEVHPQAIAGQNGQGRPFTIKTVNTALMQSKTQLTNLKSKLAKDEQLYTQLETKLAAMNTSVNRNAKQQQAHAAAIGKLQSQLQNDKQKIDQLRTMLPALQNQLDALPTMAKVANELDGHAAIEFRVLYQIDKRSIVLFATSNAPIDEPQPNP